MVEFLKTWVLNIVTLAVFIVLLEILIPNGRIKKVVNLISGFILIIAIITPVLGFVRKGADLREFQITNSNFLDRKEIEASGRILKDKQMKQIADNYRSKITKQIEDDIKGIKGLSYVKAEVTINDDYKSQSFGEVGRVLLSIGMEEKNTGIKPVLKVEKIEITGRDEKRAKEKKEPDPLVKDQIEGKVNKLLGVQKENIIISVVGG